MKKIKPITARTAKKRGAASSHPPHEAAKLAVRRQLQKKIIEAVRRSGLTHKQVAEAAVTSRARLTALLNGSAQPVSTDLMLRILAVLGYTAKLTFRRHAD